MIKWLSGKDYNLITCCLIGVLVNYTELTFKIK